MSQPTPSTNVTTHAVTRRGFLRTAASGAVAVCAAPAVVTAQKTDTQIILGTGDHRYEVLHDWVQLPDPFFWQVTHNVAVDRDGLLYVIHEGRRELTDHPAIFVFDPSGRYVRSFAAQFQGGGHGLEVRQEGDEQFLYVTAYQHLKQFAKLTLTGEVVWERRAPMESGRYVEGEDTQPQKVWGRDRFMPTNCAFRADGGFYVADGYGAWCVHHYDRNAQWLGSFGKPGTADGEFSLPHGIWIDDRQGREPSVVVADRVNARLQWFSLAGEHQRTLTGFLLPANIDVSGDLMLVPDLQARITLLDGENRVITHLGEDPAWRAEVLADNMQLRGQPQRWRAGHFVHPHDACFDRDGNIFVAEWVATGRVTKLQRLA